MLNAYVPALPSTTHFEESGQCKLPAKHCVMWLYTLTVMVCAREQVKCEVYGTYGYRGHLIHLCEILPRGFPHWQLTDNSERYLLGVYECKHKGSKNCLLEGSRLVLASWMTMCQFHLPSCATTSHWKPLRYRMTLQLPKIIPPWFPHVLIINTCHPWQVIFPHYL